MDIIETNNYKELLRNSLYIGRGTTAYCFLLKNGMVLKLFKKSYMINSLFSEQKIKERLEDIHEIQNDSYIGPEILVMNKDKVIGYLYPFIEAKTFKKISSKTTLYEIYEHLGKLLDDTKDISKKGFYLIDMHHRNMLFDGNYYIIDLDKGYIMEQKDYILRSNIFQLYDTIYSEIFNIKPWDVIEFNNPDFNKLFYNNSWVDEYESRKLFDAVRYYTHTDNPTIKQMKRIPHTVTRNSYY